MNKKIINDKIINSCKSICIGSFSTSLHLVFPLIKVLNKLGSVNLITEDKSFIPLSEDLSSDYFLGNVHIRIVDCVSTMDIEELNFKDYTYSIVDIKEFIPPIDIDKYIFLTNRDYYRQQLVSAETRNKQIYSIYPSSYYTAKEVNIVKRSKFVHEHLINIKQYSSYDKDIHLLIDNKKFNYRINIELIKMIITILGDCHRLSTSNIRSFLGEECFQ